MKQEIINGGNARYLGELERFKDGIPFGIVNKTKTDVGGTYRSSNDGSSNDHRMRTDRSNHC